MSADSGHSATELRTSLDPAAWTREKATCKSPLDSALNEECTSLWNLPSSVRESTAESTLESLSWCPSLAASLFVISPCKNSGLKSHCPDRQAASNCASASSGLIASTSELSDLAYKSKVCKHPKRLSDFIILAWDFTYSESPLFRTRRPLLFLLLAAIILQFKSCPASTCAHEPSCSLNLNCNCNALVLFRPCIPSGSFKHSCASINIRRCRGTPLTESFLSTLSCWSSFTVCLVCSSQASTRSVAVNGAPTVIAASAASK